MKKCVSILLLLVVNSCLSQSLVLDPTIPLPPAKKAVPALDSLAQKLTAAATSDLQKVTALFNWITDNIAYRARGIYPRFSRVTRSLDEQLDEDTSVYKTLDERVAEQAFKNKEAVCDGYARLFKTLCDYAGITSEVIVGYARTNQGSIQFRSNHKWNAVMIDSAWYLLDATWGSGFISFANDFIKSYDASYFLAPPQNFIKDHYPEDLRWTLLSNPPTLSEFNQTPFRYTGFLKRQIISYKPSNGIIEASVGDTLLFEMETADKEKKLWVTDTAYNDTSEVSIFAQLPKPDNLLRGNKVHFSYVVPASNVQWLYVIYNDELVMRYRLKLKKDSPENKLALSQ